MSSRVCVDANQTLSCTGKNREHPPVRPQERRLRRRQLGALHRARLEPRGACRSCLADIAVAAISKAPASVAAKSVRSVRFRAGMTRTVQDAWLLGLEVLLRCPANRKESLP
jgi:hypothetical protein